jgi:DNA-binding winged helix-turn-helix (wHTH) protein
MRRRIMVIGPDAGLRARLARLVSGAGYRPEVAESLAHARRAGLGGVALAIVARDGSDASDAAAVEAMTAEVGRVLVVASPDAKRPFPSDVVDLSDEAALLAQIAEALTSQPEGDEAELILEFAGYRLDLAGHSLADPVGRDIPLSHTEFGLLRAFVERAGRVLSRDQLMQVTAGRDAEPYDRSVDVQVSRLRRKIEPDSKRPSLIVTVPGSGYKFAAQVREARLTSAPPGPEPSPAPSGPPPRTPERRHITARAAELAPAAGGRLPADPEDLAAVVGAFRGQASAAFARYGGVIGESRGPEIFAYFGYPTAHENDAERAVRAALAIQRGLAQHNVDNAGKDAPKLSARIGLECGLVVVDATGEMIGETACLPAQFAP